MKPPLEYQGFIHEGLTLGAPTLRAPGPEDFALPAHFSRWDGILTPVDDQGKTGTCAAQAMTRIIETMICAHSTYRPRLDALAFYRAVWALEHHQPWPGDEAYQTGLKPETAYTMGVLAGLLPPDSERVHAVLTTPSLVHALSITPLFVASCVTDGWANPLAFGEIAPRMVTGSGHAYTAVGLRRGQRDGAVQMLTFANSWGEGWGPCGGFFQMTMGEYARVCWISPYAIAADWAKWVNQGDWRVLV